MKRTLITTAIVVVAALAALFAFNRLTARKDKAENYVKAEKGDFEISISVAGELLAERSMDIMGPSLASQGPGGPGMRGGAGGFGGGGGGNRGGGGIRISEFTIQDIVNEGTMVKKGDYVAQLDRTTYDNTLKDEIEELTTLRTNVEMKKLDTALTLTNLRDELKNQRFTVEEAQITLDQSRYEPPATIRQAEINLDKAQRSLEQKLRSYDLRVAQAVRDISNSQRNLREGEETVAQLQEFLSKFRITAPADGMVTYKKDPLGKKIKAGSSIHPFENVVATLPDLSSMLTKTYVSEIEVNKVKPGQKVNITIDAFPGKSFTATIMTVANIGEVLPNSDAKMFEVMIKLDESDPSLRPGMTTSNKIIINTFDDVIFIPTECVNTGPDTIPFVYAKNHTKKIVILGDFNEKQIIVEKGLEPSEEIYLIPPENTENFRLVGEELIPEIRERQRLKREMNSI